MVKNSSVEKMMSVAVKAVAEMTSIVVAVLFALWADQWWEERKLTLEAQEMAVKIELELTENLARVKKSHQHHSNQIDLIKSKTSESSELTEDDYKNIHRALFSKGIFNPATIYFTNWEIAVEKGVIAKLPESQLQKYKSAYSRMTQYIDEWKSITDNQVLVALLAKTELERLQLTFGALTEVWWKEHNIIMQMEPKSEKRKAP